MSCFLMIYHKYLEILFSRKMKNDMVFILILGGQHVAISLILFVFFEFHVFSQVHVL